MVIVGSFIIGTSLLLNPLSNDSYFRKSSQVRMMEMVARNANTVNLMSLKILFLVTTIILVALALCFAIESQYGIAIPIS